MVKFHADCLQRIGNVGGELWLNNAAEFYAPKLKQVKKIVLTRSKIKDVDINVPDEIRNIIMFI